MGFRDPVPEAEAPLCAAERTSQTANGNLPLEFRPWGQETREILCVHGERTWMLMASATSNVVFDHPQAICSVRWAKERQACYYE